MTFLFKMQWLLSQFCVCEDGLPLSLPIQQNLGLHALAQRNHRTWNAHAQRSDYGVVFLTVWNTLSELPTQTLESPQQLGTMRNWAGQDTFTASPCSKFLCCILSSWVLHTVAGWEDQTQTPLLWITLPDMPPTPHKSRLFLMIISETVSF